MTDAMKIYQLTVSHPLTQAPIETLLIKAPSLAAARKKIVTRCIDIHAATPVEVADGMSAGRKVLVVTEDAPAEPTPAPEEPEESDDGRPCDTEPAEPDEPTDPETL